MTSRTEILNYLAGKHDLKSYLEIGTQNVETNFNKIICPEKLCVDPDPAAAPDFLGTSDEFFAVNKRKFDLIFIDGLHHAEQVKKDLINALECLSDDGFIVLHDMLPVEEIHAKVPRESKVWNGDVYRIAFDIIENWYWMNFIIIDTDHGCGVISKHFSEKAFSSTGESVPYTYDWNYYLNNKSRLPIIEPADIERHL